MKQATNATNIRVLVGGTVREAAHLARERRAAAALAERPAELSRVRREHGLAAPDRQHGRDRRRAARHRRDQRGGHATRGRRGRRRARRARGRRGALARAGRVQRDAGRHPDRAGAGRGHAVPARHRDRGGPLREPEHLRLGRGHAGHRGLRRRRLAQNSSCAIPGVTVQYRTNKGYRFETSLTPRYILDRPTLAGQTAAGTSQFGAFIDSRVEVLRGTAVLCTGTTAKYRVLAYGAPTNAPRVHLQIRSDRASGSSVQPGIRGALRDGSRYVSGTEYRVLQCSPEPELLPAAPPPPSSPSRSSRRSSTRRARARSRRAGRSPSSSTGAPRMRSKSPTTGIEPPSPVITGSRPNARASARRAGVEQRAVELGAPRPAAVQVPSPSTRDARRRDALRRAPRISRSISSGS